MKPCKYHMHQHDLCLRLKPQPHSDADKCVINLSKLEAQETIEMEKGGSEHL